MATPNENDQPARSGEVDDIWRETEELLAQFERDKEAFARETGVQYEQYVEYFTKQAEHAAANADQKTLADMQQHRKALAEEFELEISQSQARHEAQKQLNRSTGGIKARRLRNRV